MRERGEDTEGGRKTGAWGKVCKERMRYRECECAGVFMGMCMCDTERESFGESACNCSKNERENRD